VPAWVIVVIAIVGLPVLAMAGCVVCGVAMRGAGTSQAEACKRAVADLDEWTKRGGPSGFDDARLDSWERDMAKGEQACRGAGLESEAKILAAARKDIADARHALRAPSASTAAATTTIDPASCPKGRVMIDAATGKAIRCTGEVTAGPVPAFVNTLAALAGNPKAVKPKKVEHDQTNEENSYEYAFAPFSAVTLAVSDSSAARWTFDVKGRGFNGEDLGPRGAVKKLCQKGVARFKTLAQWYRIDGGPLAGAYAATWEPDASTIGGMIVSADEMRAEMEHEVTLGLARPPSLDKYVCPDGG
jgi:hypothetical protein